MNETQQTNQQCAWCNRPGDTCGGAVEGGFLAPLPDGQVSYHGPAVTQLTRSSLTTKTIDGREVLLCEACLFLATRGKS